MLDDIGIKVNDLSKVYKLYNSPVDRLKESLHPLRRQYHHNFYALNDVSFEINKGESVGIIGKNGSGKSTLLKSLTGVLTPTSGKVAVNGKVSALLELGAGFNPELSGMENVYFNGMLMGYSSEEMDKRLEDILAFANIGEHVHQAVKTYSSGMFVRLAFSLAVNVEPDILIVDEALSVGDVFFQQKCYAKLRDKIDSGVTCLFVSHDLQAVRNICNRGIFLSEGRIIFDGRPEEAVSRYLASMGSLPRKERPGTVLDDENAKASSNLADREDILSHSILSSQSDRHGEGKIRIVAAMVTDQYGDHTLTVPMLTPVWIYLLLEATQPVVDITTGIHLYDRFGNLIFASGARQLGIRLPDLTPGEALVVKLTLSLNLQPAEYTFSLGVAECSPELHDTSSLQDRCENLGPLVVTADHTRMMPFYGITQLPLFMEYQQAKV